MSADKHWPPVPEGFHLAADQDAEPPSWPPYKFVVGQLRRIQAATIPASMRVLAHALVHDPETGREWMNERKARKTIKTLGVTSSEIRKTGGRCLPREWTVQRRVRWYVIASIDQLDKDDLTAWSALAAEAYPLYQQRLFELIWGADNATMIGSAYGRVEVVIATAAQRADAEIADYRFDRLLAQRADMAVDEAMHRAWGGRGTDIQRPEHMGTGTTGADIQQIFKAAVWHRVLEGEGGPSADARRQANSAASVAPKHDPEEIGYVAMAWCEERGLDWLAMNDSPPKGEARKMRAHLWADLLDAYGFSTLDVARHWGVSRQAVDKSVKNAAARVATRRQTERTQGLIATDELHARDAERLLAITHEWLALNTELLAIAERYQGRFPNSKALKDTVDALIHAALAASE